MTTHEQQVMLSFLKEQQHYNEALASFLQLVLNITPNQVEVSTSDIPTPDNPHSDNFV